jgi:hypothetical protein
MWRSCNCGCYNTPLATWTVQGSGRGTSACRVGGVGYEFSTRGSVVTVFLFIYKNVSDLEYEGHIYKPLAGQSNSEKRHTFLRVRVLF